MRNLLILIILLLPSMSNANGVKFSSQLDKTTWEHIDRNKRIIFEFDSPYMIFKEYNNDNLKDVVSFNITSYKNADDLHFLFLRDIGNSKRILSIFQFKNGLLHLILVSSLTGKNILFRTFSPYNGTSYGVEPTPEPTPELQTPDITTLSKSELNALKKAEAKAAKEAAAAEKKAAKEAAAAEKKAAKEAAAAEKAAAKEAAAAEKAAAKEAAAAEKAAAKEATAAEKAAAKEAKNTPAE